jgi:hypothetical protein
VLSTAREPRFCRTLARAAAIPSGAIQVRFKRSLMNHLDPARAFHLAGGEPGLVSK